MGIYGIKPWFRQQLQPLIKLLWNVHPDVLTWAALFLSCVAGDLLYLSDDEPWYASVAAVLLFVRLALNALDGLLAQQTGKARVAGEVLNEMTDRFADLAIFTGLILCPLTDPTIGVAAMILVLLVSYTGILGKAVGAERVYSGILGKADRMIYLMIACIAYDIEPRLHIFGHSIYTFLMLIFIPMAVITIAQRLQRILFLVKEKKA